MVTQDELLEAIRKMIKKAEDPKLQKRFENFTKTLLMSFHDLGTDISITFIDGKGSVESRTIESPDMVIKTDSMTIIEILAGHLSAMRAVMSGKIKADGPARDLMKLQHLLKG
jgi:putative sterol carrier protein